MGEKKAVNGEKMCKFRRKVVILRGKKSYLYEILCGNKQNSLFLSVLLMFPLSFSSQNYNFIHKVGICFLFFTVVPILPQIVGPIIRDHINTSQK